MASILAKCPKCSTEGSVDESYSGKTATCKKCGTSFTIPSSRPGTGVVGPPPSGSGIGGEGALQRGMKTRLSLPQGFRLRDGEYVIESCLGSGGFAITYMASDSRLNRPVAVKEFLPMGCFREGGTVRTGGRWSPEEFDRFRSRFVEEGRALAKLRHPSIPQVHSVLEENGTVYLVMEFVEGTTLEQHLWDRGGQLPVDEAIEVIRQAGEALAVVHAEGLLHRDLKPANLMRRVNGQVTLVDFGAAREFAAEEAQSHTVIHTTGYAPVEQYTRHGKRGPFTDVYALSATMYHLLTGDAPIDARIRALEGALPPPRELRPEVPEEVSEAVMRGLGIKAADRPATVAEFLTMLTRKAVREVKAPAEPPFEPAAARLADQSENAGFVLLPDEGEMEESPGDGFSWIEEPLQNEDLADQGFTLLD